jgi:predicted nucleic acid-binding protein
MSSRVFLDTNGWLALLNATEKLHVQALDRWLDLIRHGSHIVLTDWVIAETGNGLARSRRKSQFAAVVQEMMEAPSVELVLVDRDLLRRALPMYVQHTDKSWGLVDCASFLVVREQSITQAFTSDGHFE